MHKICSLNQWWNVTRYINLSTVHKCTFEVLVLLLSISNLCNCIVLLQHISEAEIVLFTLLLLTVLVTFHYITNCIIVNLEHLIL